MFSINSVVPATIFTGKYCCFPVTGQSFDFLNLLFQSIWQVISLLLLIVRFGSAEQEVAALKPFHILPGRIQHPVFPELFLII